MATIFAAGVRGTVDLLSISFLIVLGIANSAQAQESPLIKFTRCHGASQVTQSEVQQVLDNKDFEVLPWATEDQCQGAGLSVLTVPGSYVEALAALTVQYAESLEAEDLLSNLSKRVTACDPSSLEDAFLWVCPSPVEGSYFVDDKNECSRGKQHPSTHILNIGDYAERYAYKRPKTNESCADLTRSEVTNSIRRYAPKTSLFYIYTSKVMLNLAHGLKNAMDNATWDCLGGLCLNSEGNSLVTETKFVSYNGQQWTRTAQVCGGKIVAITYYKIFFEPMTQSLEFERTQENLIRDHIKLGWAPPLDQPNYPLLLRYDKKGLREIKQRSIQYNGKTYRALSITTHHPQSGEICHASRTKELQ